MVKKVTKLQMTLCHVSRRKASQRAEIVANVKQATISPERQARIPVFIRYAIVLDVPRDLHGARPPEICRQRDSCITAWVVSKMRKIWMGTGQFAIRNLTKQRHRKVFLEGYETFQNFYRNFHTRESDPLDDQP